MSITTPLTDRDRRIVDLYTGGQSVRAVAAQVGLGSSIVHRILVAAGTPMRSRGPARDDTDDTPRIPLRTSADTAEDVAFILEHDRHETAQHIAPRLGYRDTTGLYTALRRAHRPDLIDQLVRNTRAARGEDVA